MHPEVELGGGIGQSGIQGGGLGLETRTVDTRIQPLFRLRGGGERGHDLVVCPWLWAVFISNPVSQDNTNVNEYEEKFSLPLSISVSMHVW